MGNKAQITIEIFIGLERSKEFVRDAENDSKLDLDADFGNDTFWWK